jgi:hypothetical protein
MATILIFIEDLALNRKSDSTKANLKYFSVIKVIISSSGLSAHFADFSPS